jgi:chaperonin cofactor prefoldin
MSEERFDRLEALITNIGERVDVMQQDINNIRVRVDAVQEDVNNIRVRIDAEGTMTDTFERYFIQIMEQGNRSAQITLDNNRDIGDIQERVERIERQQRRMNSRLNNLDR